MMISEQTTFGAMIFWISFCFLQVYQQKRVGMVSTNNVLRTYSEEIHIPF